ncbi:hypothetical protein [Salinigranum marinum]|uniref:hypothetical protein n=1 Tax=Salinigranum marinum TaxID=1515595 RepID=UPI002989A040|nr:hypothetical protein [Salinigranum marinum]
MVTGDSAAPDAVRRADGLGDDPDDEHAVRDEERAAELSGQVRNDPDAAVSKMSRAVSALVGA